MSKTFDYRVETVCCLSCKCSEFSILKWYEYDDKEWENYEESIRNIMTATFTTVSPQYSIHEYKQCKNCGNIYKSYQPEEWKCKLIECNKEDVLYRYNIYKNKPHPLYKL